MRFRYGTIYLHINTSTTYAQSWRWTEGGESGLWELVQIGEEVEFPHGKYIYSVTRTGAPSWIVYNTFRKKKYGSRKDGKGKQAA
jgi:hypothetical protein